MKDETNACLVVTQHKQLHNINNTDVTMSQTKVINSSRCRSCQSPLRLVASNRNNLVITLKTQRRNQMHKMLNNNKPE